MTLRSLFTIGVLAISLGACASAAPVAPRQQGAPGIIGSEQDIARQLGRKVRVIGAATNTQHGPSIVDAGVVVYLDECRPFPGSVVGKRIEATGVIVRDNASAGFVRVVDGKEMVFLKNPIYNVLDGSGEPSSASPAGNGVTPPAQIMGLGLARE